MTQAVREMLQSIPDPLTHCIGFYSFDSNIMRQKKSQMMFITENQEIELAAAGREEVKLEAATGGVHPPSI